MGLETGFDPSVDSYLQTVLLGRFHADRTNRVRNRTKSLNRVLVIIEIAITGRRQKSILQCPNSNIRRPASLLLMRSDVATSRTPTKCRRRTRVKKTTPSTNDKAQGKGASVRWRLPDGGLGGWGCPVRLYLFSHHVVVLPVGASSRESRKAALESEDIPEIAITSTITPGVTHRWTSMATFTDEVANARIWAGFHYRFSTRVGTEMGRAIGDYVVKNVMQPTQTSSR
jgi:hypothetical protein